MTPAFHKVALAPSVAALAFFLAQASCEKECESGLYDLEGQCVTACDDGWFLGIDGRCHPIDAADADADTDGDIDADSDTDADVDSDADDPGDVGPLPDGDDDDVPDSDLFVDGCTDEASCAALAQPALDLINDARGDVGCGEVSLSLDPVVTVAARECASMMASAGNLDVCPGTVRSRLTALGFEGYADVSEWYSRSRSIDGAVDQLLTSPYTSTHILDCRYSIAGLAIAADADLEQFYIDVIIVEP